MTWQELSPDARMEWLTKYATATLSVTEYRELAQAATVDDELLADMAALTPLRLKLQDADWRDEFLGRTKQQSWWERFLSAIAVVPRPVWATAALAVGVWLALPTFVEEWGYLRIDATVKVEPKSVAAHRGVSLVIPHPEANGQHASMSGKADYPTCTGMILPGKRMVTVRVIDQGVLKVLIPAPGPQDTELQLSCSVPGSSEKTVHPYPLNKYFTK